jgi:hypothetical protein
MEKINESSLIDNLITNNDKTIKKSFKIKKLPSSILDNLKSQQQLENKQVVADIPFDIPSDIIIPKKLSEIQQENVVQKIVEKKELINKVEELKKRALLREKNKNVPIQKTQIKQNIDNFQVEETKDELQEIIANKQLIETYQELTNTELSEDVDLVKISEEIQEAAEEIPGTEDLSINDFVIEENKKGSGWFKNKVTIKSEIAGKELSEIATIVKASTNNIVLHRAMDFRTIGNANKTQLKNSDYKLYAISYVFRPVAGAQIKADKYARIAISVPNEFGLTNRVLVFMQESRQKFITEINCDIQFLSKVISDFYIVGFAVTKARLNSNGVDNPLNPLINKLTLSRDYLVNPIQDEDTKVINKIIIKTKNGKHQWLGIVITKSNLEGTYLVKANSKPDVTWQFGILKPDKSPITISYLMSDKFFENLNNLFNDFDWSKFGMGEDDLENRQFYLLSKISYRALKNAFIEIYDLQSETPELGIFIKEALSQLDTSKDINSGYKAEVIIGKTNYIDYFVLSWSAVLIEGGDKRNGKDYITTEEYYEKYSVNDRREYNERENTVLAKQNSERNYNSRPFIFTIVYSINNKVNNFSAKTFEEIKTLTGFLSSNPKSI